MHKNQAKAFSLILCGLLMALSVTACKSSSSSASSTTIDKNGQYNPGITISTVRTLDGLTKFDSTNPDQKSLTENIWATAYQKQLGITFNYLWTPNTDQYDTKWNVSIASGDIPDMAVVDNTIYKTLLKGGFVEDMTKTYSEYASADYKKYNEEENNSTIKYMTTGGKLYGLPRTGTQPDGTAILYIRKDWLDKAGLSEPKTIDDLVNVAKVFKDKQLGGKDTFGISLSKNVNTYAGFLNGYGAYYDQWVKDSSGKLTYGTIQSQMRTALIKLQQMYKDGLISQDFAVKDETKAAQDIAADKVGILYSTFGAPLGILQTEMMNNSTSRWEALPILTSDGSTPKVQGTATPGTFIFVKKGYAHPEAAVKLENLLYKLKYGDSLNYGTTAKGVAVFKYAFACESSIPWLNLQRYQLFASLKNFDADVSTIPGWAQAQYSAVKKGLEGDRSSLGYNLVFGTSSSAFKVINDYKNKNEIVIDAYQSLPTDTMVAKSDMLKTNLDAAILQVIMGADISTFDKSVTAWKSGGGDTMTKEVNDWYSKNK
jgi:putative aldouronate transport system substrate-binding protein